MALIDTGTNIAQGKVSDSPRWIVLFGGVALVVLVGGFGAWAGLGKVSSASSAVGVIAAEGHRKAVQHREGGPVAAILVKEGDLVHKGQVLIRLDLSDTAAEVQVLNSQRVQTQVRLARLRAESSGTAQITFPPEIEALRQTPEFGGLFLQEVSLFQARRNAYDGNINLLHQQIEGFHRRIEGLKGKSAATKAQLALIRQELSTLLGLLKKGYVEKSRVLALQRAEAGLVGDIQSMAADVAGAENEIAKAQLQIGQIDKEWRETVAKDLNEAESVIAQIEPRLESARERLRRSELVAPEDGFVYAMKVHSLGATVSPGDVVLEIVPASEPLVVKAKVDPNDIDRVAVGQDVEIHLLAYRQRYMSLIQGKLIKISADSFTEPNNNTSWFEATISISPGDLSRSGALLVPGMAVNAQINTGTRTIGAYLLDPLYHFYDYAMKED